jgi:hypothetical protein
MASDDEGYSCGFCKAQSPEIESTIKAVRGTRCWVVLCGSCRSIPEHLLSKDALKRLVAK